MESGSCLDKNKYQIYDYGKRKKKVYNVCKSFEIYRTPERTPGKRSKTPEMELVYSWWGFFFLTLASPWQLFHKKYEFYKNGFQKNKTWSSLMILMFANKVLIWHYLIPVSGPFYCIKFILCSDEVFFIFRLLKKKIKFSKYFRYWDAYSHKIQGTLIKYIYTCNVYSNYVHIWIVN